jgi:phospholipid-binding lipoprotein MlaA
MSRRRVRLVATAVGALALLCLSACAGTQPPRPDDDPFEGFNRSMFWFNDQLDIYALEPIARGWDHLWPDPVQRGFNNFFDNLRFPIVLVNDILQARPRSAVETIARFQCNTFLGGLGFWDLASDLGVPPHIQDTGLTLGRWGMAPGPYLVWPLIGPSNPRDTAGFIADSGLAVYPFFVSIPGITIGAGAIDIINRRSRVLDQVSEVKAASLDYYTFVRNAYVQRRWKLVHGETPAGGAQEDELYNTEIYEDFIEEGN